MKTAQDINDSFRKEIRNRQKQQLFKSIRSKYDKGLDGGVGMMVQNIQSSIISNSEAHLKKLGEEIKNSDGIKACNKLLDQGLHHQLIQNLKNNTKVEATLQVLSALICKQKVKVAHKFVRLGLIELIISHSQNLQYLSMCMNILANIIFQNTDYSEMMLQNNIQRNLFQLLCRLTLQKNNPDINQQESGFTVMWALAALLQTQNAVNYKDQFIEILQFAIAVYQKQLYTGIIIQIIFLVGYTFRQQTQQIATIAINSILSSVTTQTKYLQHLLITIKLLSPLNIQYSTICNLTMTAQPRQLSYCVRILSKICTSYPDSIPRNFEWWQRFYLKLNKIQDIQQFIILLRQAKIKQQFVYKILKDIMQRHAKSSLTLASQTLICLNQHLEQNKSLQERKQAKFYVKSAGIYQQLQKLYKSNNTNIQRKCQYLLTTINLMDTMS